MNEKPFGESAVDSAVQESRPEVRQYRAEEPLLRRDGDDFLRVVRFCSPREHAPLPTVRAEVGVQ